MYERFFGLVDEPFRLTPDPRYLFLSPKHAEALAHLRFGLTESSGFVCVTGDVGTGKTTLLRSFLAELGPEVATAYIFNPAVTSLELLQRINRELGLASESRSEMELIDALNAHLMAQRKAGRLSVVVVDEAQAFSIELLERLRLLSNLETTTEKLLRVILVGQPQLRTLLTDPALAQLNQRITLRWHMGPLSYAETVAYVHHRLGVASRGQAQQLFTTAAQRGLHRLSGGVPRLINMLAHHAMLGAFVKRQPTVTVRSVVRAYREIGALPLPDRRPHGVSRGATWAAGAVAAAAVVVGVVTLGMPRLGWRLPVDALAPPPVQAHGAPPVDASHEPPAPGAAAPVETAAVPKPAVADTTPPDAAATTAADVERRLAAVDAKTSARNAIGALLAAWHVRPLAADEAASADDLERIGFRRGLQYLPLNGNRAMLALLDLPAVLELRAGSDGARWVLLTGMDERRVTLAVDGSPVVVDAAFLDQFWFGQTHVLWRDFDDLGPPSGLTKHGPQVSRLQGLLRRAGIYGGEPTGDFDEATAAAVVDFQRSRRLVADGRIGRLTRIVLYAAAGGYPRPTLLTPQPGGPS